MLNKKVLRWMIPCRLDTGREFSITMPVHAQILKVAFKPHDSSPSIWALCNDENNPKMEKRNFLILGTGHVFKPDSAFRVTYNYLATIFEDNDDSRVYVWHIFEVIP